MTDEKHFAETDIQRFSRGESAAGETRQVTEHLLGGCNTCRVSASRYLGIAADVHPRPETWHATGALQRVLARVQEHESTLSRERVDAEVLVEALRKQPQARRLTVVRNSRRYSTWGVCELLVERAKEASYDDATLAIEWGELAVLAASRLDPKKYVASLVADIHGRALIALANAKRVASDLAGAEVGFAAAQVELERGTGDPLEEAYYHHCLSGLRFWQRRYPEAFRSIDHAIATYRRLGDQHLEARSLVSKAVFLSHNGDVEAAIRLDERALELIEPHRDSRLQLIVLHNLAFKLANNGQPDRARRVLAEARPMYERFGDRISLSKLRWLEARIAVATGNAVLGETSLVEVRNAFMTLEIPYEAALVALELAALYIEQGRTADVKRQVAEMMPIFNALEVQPEAFAALILFRQAVEREVVTGSSRPRGRQLPREGPAQPGSALPVAVGLAGSPTTFRLRSARRSTGSARRAGAGTP